MEEFDISNIPIPSATPPSTSGPPNDEELKKFWEQAQSNLQRISSTQPAAPSYASFQSEQFYPPPPDVYYQQLQAYNQAMLSQMPQMYAPQNNAMSAANRLAAERRLREVMPAGACINPIRPNFQQNQRGGFNRPMRPQFTRMQTPVVSVQASEGRFVYSDLFSRMIPENVKEYIDHAYDTLPSNSMKPQLEYYLKERVTPLLDSGLAAQINWDAEPMPHKIGFQVSSSWVPAAKMPAKVNSTMRGASNMRGGKKTTGANNIEVSSLRKRPSKFDDYEPGRSRNGIEKSSSPPMSKREIKRKMKEQLGLNKGKKKVPSESVQKYLNKGIGFVRAFDEEHDVQRKQLRAMRFQDDAPSSSNIRTRGHGPSHDSSFLSRNQLPVSNSSRNFKSIISKCSLQRRRRIIGTCTQIEKPYFRLNAQPDPSQVRPYHILKQALEHVRNKYESTKDYTYATDQLKSIRQDILTQDINNDFAVEVYETHVLLAIKNKDREEMNQSQQQLKILYEKLRSKNRWTFTAYRLLYYVYVEGESDATELLRKFKDDIDLSKALRFARGVYIAYTTKNFHKLLNFYKKAPSEELKEIMDFFVERERNRYLKSIIAAFRPNLPSEALCKMLRFDERELTEYLTKHNIQLDNGVLDVRKYSALTLSD